MKPHLRAVIVLAGFVWCEVGIAQAWSPAVAGIVGGAVLMLVGTWPYLVVTWRRRP